VHASAKRRSVERISIRREVTLILSFFTSCVKKRQSGRALKAKKRARMFGWRVIGKENGSIKKNVISISVVCMDQFSRKVH